MWTDILVGGGLVGLALVAVFITGFLVGKRHGAEMTATAFNALQTAHHTVNTLHVAGSQLLQQAVSTVTGHNDTDNTAGA